MVNQWVEFVKQYAKANNISYGNAIKEAGPAYRRMKMRGKSTLRGKGLNDLPDVLQEKIGDNLDNNSLDNFSNAFTEINRNQNVKDELQRRSNIAQMEFRDWNIKAGQLERRYHTVMMNFLNTSDRGPINIYYDKAVVTLNRLAKLQNEQLLSDQKRESARSSVVSLQRIVALMSRYIIRNNLRGR